MIQFTIVWIWLGVSGPEASGMRASPIRRASSSRIAITSHELSASPGRTRIWPGRVCAGWFTIAAWAAAGAEWLARAAARVTGRLGWIAPARQNALTLLLAGGVLAALVAQSARYLPDVTDISQTRNLDVRLAGELIRADAARRTPSVDRPLIATGGLAVAHYAGGEVTYLPYADEVQSLSFLRQRSPQYVVLRVDQLQGVPYAAQWIERGPASCAELLSGPEAAAIPRVKVWRWTCAPAESLP